MKVVVVANQKGGAGKTTITRNLAVAAGEDVAIIDRDPQGSLTSWWNRRAAETPALVPVSGSLAETLEALRTAGARLVFVDTPPAANANLAGIIGLADLVVIPCRPTPDDLDAVGPTLDLIAGARKPFVFVLSQATPRTKLALEAVPELAQHGRVAPVVLHVRQDYPSAALTGLGVTETGDSAASTEVKQLLAYVMTQLAKEAHQ
jgi:chromosome partitioning protein